MVLSLAVRALIPALVLTLLAASAPRAQAQAAQSKASERTVAVVGVQITGDAAPELREQLQESLRKGLQRKDHTVIGVERVHAAIGESQELIGCISTTCLERIGERVKADKFLRLQVDGSGAAYTVVLELLSPKVEGGVARRIEDSCAVCTISELSELVANAAAELLSPEQARPAPVTIVSNPPGATLRIDGGEPTASPFEGTLAAGTHVVAAELPGHAPHEQRIEITGEAAQRFEIVLVPDRVSLDAPRPYRHWKWAAAGGSVAAIVTGAVLIGLDGDGTCDPTPPVTECERVYDTMAGGILTVGAGLALGAASGWMFYKDRPTTERAPRVGVVVLPDRAGLTVSGSF